MAANMEMSHMTASNRGNVRGRSRWSAPLLALLAGAGLAGCGGLLDVENPNNVNAEDVEKPAAATALANGAQRQVSFGVDGLVLLASEASDELEWSGSRDAWLEIDQGKFSNGYNEFSDANIAAGATYSGVAFLAARWLADKAVAVLEAQQKAGTLIDKSNLAKAYLWSAIWYVSAADLMDDVVLGSNRDSAAAPIGEAAMRTLYDTAVTRLTKGLALATGTLRVDILMMRARAYFNQAIWDRVHNPKRAGGGIVAAGANVSAAVADAQAALAAAPSPTYRLQFTYSAATGSSEFGGWIGSRQEMRIAPTYAARVGSAKWGATTLMDPIDNTADPRVDAEQKMFAAASTYWPLTITSTREMYLILAEAALAGVGSAGTFAGNINALRALDGLSAWTGAAGQPSAQGMLAYERQANLFLMGRRLADHYRFNVRSPEWLPNSQAVTQPGTFFPITARECLSNPNIGAAKCST